MCSTPVQRIAQIGQAIDDLAADAQTAYGPGRRGRLPAEPDRASPQVLGEAAVPAAGPAVADPAVASPAAAGPAAAGPVPAEPSPEPGPGAASEADRVVIRLAELWGQLAELDPEVARRLAGYEV